MLTKNLVKFRIRKGRIHPAFIDPNDEALLEGAELLVSLFEDSVGRTRESLAEEVNQLVDALPCETVIGRGFEKLLMDRTEFQVPDDEEHPQTRAHVFAATSKALAEDDFEDYEAFRHWSAANLGLPLEQMAEKLYADLPAQNPVIEFRPINAAGLLHRYNCSLIQWLLLSAARLEIVLPGVKAGSLRQLFKYMRFHQLLADIQVDGEDCKLLIEGPLSLFYQTRRYGMNLARFFPALLHQERWSLRAELTVSETRKGLLQLDQEVGIRPPTQRFHDYVPEEITRFRETVAEKCKGWQVLKTPSLVKLKGETRCFPDFSLKHDSGTKVAIELFHPWHATQLITRLDQLDGRKDAPLLVGVAFKLARKNELAERLEASPYYGQWGFDYRDLPTITKLRPLLEALLV